MNYKRTLTILFLAPCIVFSALTLLYFLKPAYFYFRAWEYFDNLVIAGPYSNHQILEESGDSSRMYLFQPYVNKNGITINKYGNRIACAEFGKSNQNAILMLGDSQLFGSGLDDDETLPKLLCEKFKVPIYNGSRRHELNLLGSKELSFSSIIFTSSERLGIKRFCDAFPNFDKQTLSAVDTSFEIKKSHDYDFFAKNISYLVGYLQSRLGVLMQITTSWQAPNTDIIAFQHEKTKQDYSDELSCAVRLNNFYVKQGIATAFVYFPAQQTILRDELISKPSKMTEEFIPNMVELMSSRGLSTVDTRSCLLASAAQQRVTQPHDTHLNGVGMKAMALCIEDSKLKKLFRQ